MSTDSKDLKTFYNLVMNRDYNDEFFKLLRDNPEFGYNIPTSFAWGVDEEDQEEEGLDEFYNIEDVIYKECDLIDKLIATGYVPKGIHNNIYCEHCAELIENVIENYTFVKPAKR